MTNWNPPVEDPEEWREPGPRMRSPVEHYKDWCAAHGLRPSVQDNLVEFLHALTLPRHVRVHMADHIARALFSDVAPQLLLALELAGCFS